ncbi:MAG: DNA (cytosine-5-)-methyltransferase [Gammaproteobacteria bacterium]|nr:DNA (cytosine-5-)-methyltransferase [Gammaproteobacteria bacterium]
MSLDIRSLRLTRKLRQQDIAAYLDVSGYQIRKWERGLELPPEKVLHALAGLLDVKYEEFKRAVARFHKIKTPGEGYTTAQPASRGIVSCHKEKPKGKLHVLDLFCGCGGLSYGLEWTNKFITVCGIDLLPDRIDSFLLNHGYAEGIYGDVRDLDLDNLIDIAGNIDVLVGGPPCQGFSSVRPFRALTENDRRNSLAEEYILFVGKFKPSWFVFENVVGMLNHRNGGVLTSLLDRLSEMGYKISWKVINAALYGVPQSRERLLIVGNRLDIEFKWPAPTHKMDYRSMAGKRPEVIQTLPIFSQDLPDAVTVSEAISDLPPVHAGQENNHYSAPPRTEYQKLIRRENSELDLHRATNHSRKMLEIIKHAGPNISSIPRHLISSGFSSCYSRLDADKPSTTLTVNFVHPASNRCIHPTQDRALTLREGARLQSFPDDFKFAGNIAQIAKQIGNAVPPLLAKAIGEAIHASHARSTTHPDNLGEAAIS